MAAELIIAPEAQQDVEVIFITPSNPLIPQTFLSHFPGVSRFFFSRFPPPLASQHLSKIENRDPLNPEP
jgi:hypothetical protein